MVANGAEEGAGKTIDNWGLLIWALMEKSKLSRQRIGGREVQAKGTACAKGLCPGISEKFGVTGAQGHVARTGSGGQGSGLGLRQMLSSSCLQGDWRQEGQRLETDSILARGGVDTLSYADATSTDRACFVPLLLIVHLM